MRVFLIALCACGGTAVTGPSATTPAPVATKKTVEPRPAVDVIAVLSQPLVESSWIAPGPAQLVLGGASLQAEGGAPRLEVSVLEEQGNDVRVGVRLDHARFALWMARSRLLALVAHDQRINVPGVFASGPDPMHVTLHAGAQVQRLARKGGTTHVRYVGALEVEGWIPDAALADRAPAGRTPIGRVPTGRKPLMLMPGAVIRVEPKWAAQQLAVMNQGYFVDEIQAIDQAWSEVSYEDGDVAVHGYVSKRDPPGRTHRKQAPEQFPALAPNATATDGTCLVIAGEEVGFLVGDQAIVREPSERPGWVMITIDTPWGPLGFDSKGGSKCGG
jgi:hypothetical protein